MVNRFHLLFCAMAASSILAGPAWAVGSAIQDVRSTQGLLTNGRTASDTGGTGIYTEKQRREFGYGRSQDDEGAPSR